MLQASLRRNLVYSYMIYFYMILKLLQQLQQVLIVLKYEFHVLQEIVTESHVILEIFCSLLLDFAAPRNLISCVHICIEMFLNWGYCYSGSTILIFSTFLAFGLLGFSTLSSDLVTSKSEFGIRVTSCGRCPLNSILNVAA